MAYLGHHNGTKAGKKLQAPSKPNKKAARRLAARTQAHLGNHSTAWPEQTMPGSGKTGKACGHNPGKWQ